MHPFVFSFELGWLLRFSLICPQNIWQCPENNEANNHENANPKQTEAWLNRIKRTEAGLKENFGWQTDGRRGRVWLATVDASPVYFLLPHLLDKVLQLPTHQLLAQLGVSHFIADFGEDICKHVFCWDRMNGDRTFLNLVPEMMILVLMWCVLGRIFGFLTL
jgi:hypothetical protein